MGKIPLQKKIRLSSFILTIAVVLEGVAIGLLLAYPPHQTSIGSQDVHGVISFRFDSDLTCHVVNSTHSDPNLLLPWYDEVTFSFTGLESNSPSFQRADGNTWMDLQKSYEDSDYLTVRNGDSFGSDVIGLNKQTGVFVRTIQGIQGGKYQFAIVQKGYCE